MALKDIDRPATKIDQVKLFKDTSVLRCDSVRNTQIHCMGIIQNFHVLKHVVHILTTWFQRFNYDVPRIRTNLGMLNTGRSIKLCNSIFVTKIRQLMRLDNHHYRHHNKPKLVIMFRGRAVLVFEVSSSNLGVVTVSLHRGHLLTNDVK
jgi:hypothetical protein